MKKSIITFLFLICSISIFGQSQKLTFTLTSIDEECSTLKKEIQIFSTLNGKDSLIFSDTFSVCLFELEIKRVFGNYRLNIRTKKYETTDLKFEIKPESTDYINLNSIELKKKTNNLDEVTISGIKRSFIKTEADKTTITVKDNAILTTSSVYDAIIKIPGIVPYPSGGFSVYGKNATIYFEGVPGNLSGDDLINLLKSLPATSIEKIEIISNPGASYDANISGAIINIISLSKINKWISGTLTMNYGLNQNNKLLPSLVISGKNNKISWQFQTGYSYFERSTHQKTSKYFITFNPIAILGTETKEQNISGLYYLKPSINYKINNHSNFILNYNTSFNDVKNQGVNTTSSQEINPTIDLVNNYKLSSKNVNNGLVLKYRNTFDSLKRVLDVTASYSDYTQDQLTKSSQNENTISDYSLLKYNLNLKNLYVKADLEVPFEKKKLYLQIGVKYRKLFAKSNGRYNLQNQSDIIFQNLNYLSTLDFDYIEDNLAGYIEMKKEIEKLSVGAGVRVENFTLNRKSSISQTKSNNYLNLFPSANAIYRFNQDMNLIGSYSRKIAVPTYHEFDPNNSGYYDNYNSTTGNLLLKPNFYDNMEVKFSIFDYLQLSVNYSHSQTLNLDIFTTQPNSLQSIHTFKTYQNVNSLTYFFSIPIPFGVFKKGLQFFNEPIDIDKINYMYLYTERTKTSISNYHPLNSNKPTWNYGVYSQFILPKEIRLNIDFWVGTKGTFQIYDITKQQSSLEFVFTKDFMNKKIKSSLSFQDVLNQSQFSSQISYENLNLRFYNKNDTRIIWFKLAYSFGQFDKTNENESPLDAIGVQKSEIKL